MRGLKLISIFVLVALLANCSAFLHRYIPYEDEVYPEAATNAPKPAQPVAELKVPHQIEHGRHVTHEYAITNHERAWEKREDLLVPPNSGFQR